MKWAFICVLNHITEDTIYVGTVSNAEYGEYDIYNPWLSEAYHLSGKTNINNQA